MNKLIKKSLSLILSFALVLLLSSCSSKALDYSKAENWVDCNNSNTTYDVDVFFIYPTIVMTSENGDYASMDEMRSKVGVVRMMQTSVYEDSCNIYMPFYRQASLDLAMTLDSDNQKYLDTLYKNIPYKDIEKALDYYFEHYNNNKPFIIAGHSQGSAMTLNVLMHYMQDHEEYLERMVAAYAIGFAPSEEMFETYTNLKFATCETDYNVVVSWTTEGQYASGKSILVPEHPMVINPLNWKTDSTYAGTHLNKGSLEVAKDYSSVTLVNGMADAKINEERKTVVCSTYANWTECSAFSSYSLHEGDYSLYFANLKDNVAKRIEAYKNK